MDTTDAKASRRGAMMRDKQRSSLLYMLVTLRQIQTVLRDFELEETAGLLDGVILDLDRRIPREQARERQ